VSESCSVQSGFAVSPGPVYPSFGSDGHTHFGPDGRIAGYRLRQDDPKRCVVAAFHSLNGHVVAAGDSYNDISMLRAADAGILFRPSAAVARDG